MSAKSASNNGNHSSSDAGSSTHQGSPIPGRYTGQKVGSLLGALALLWLAVGHLWTGSFILSGVATFDRAVLDSLAAYPHPSYALALDILLFWIPFIGHVVIGLPQWMRGRDNVRRYPFFRNAMYSMQRWVGLLLGLFVLFHMWNTWVLVHFSWGGLPAGANPMNPEQVVTLGQYLSALIGGSFAVQLAYVVGAFAFAFYFANGLWNAAINWGALGSTRSANGAGVVAAAIFALLFVMGINIVAEFIRLGGVA